MIVDALIGVCFFAAIVSLIAIPWMNVDQHIEQTEH
jgi:hypothetical protein